MSYDKAVTYVLKHEGGYVNDPRDPGGETKYGISKRAFPELDIANLTLADAKAIYKEHYWDRVRGDELTPGVAMVMFDCAVNQGVDRALRTAQRVADALPVDGVFGPITKRKILAMPPGEFITRYQVERGLFYASLTNWRYYGRGWMTRLLSTYRVALYLEGIRLEAI